MAASLAPDGDRLAEQDEIAQALCRPVADLAGHGPIACLPLFGARSHLRMAARERTKNKPLFLAADTG
jgi:hypothetical protein